MSLVRRSSRLAAQTLTQVATEASEAVPQKKARITKTKSTVTSTVESSSTTTVSQTQDGAQEQETEYRPYSQSKKLVGAHMSIAGGVHNAVINATKINARAFAMDTRSKRKWTSPPLSDEAAQLFKDTCKKYGFGPESILPHGSYLMNLGSPDEEVHKKSRQCLVEELTRCHQMDIKFYNFHPGSSCGKISAEECLTRIAESLNWAHELTAKQGNSVVTVLENMAGQGNVVGGPFEHLASIIDQVKDKSRMGVCIDTCHAFAYGHDLRDKKRLDKMMEDFDRIVGLKYLKGVHLNDSKEDLGSCKDRHANIGKGLIGKEAFRAIMNDPRFNHIAMILETPVDESKDKNAWIKVYQKEIEELYGMEQTGDGSSSSSGSKRK